MPNQGVNEVRNRIDHIVLTYIRSLQIEEYKHLELKPEFYSLGHSRLTIPRMKKVEQGPIKHRLYWFLSNELRPDDDIDTLYAVICAILKRIGQLALEKQGYTIPQNVFRTPSRKLLDGVRKGPKRTMGKNKLKPVLYFPFSFIKSKKFENIEPSFRKHLSECAQQTAEITSLINPMSVKIANGKLLQFQYSIKSLYDISDDIRESIAKTNTSILPEDLLQAVKELKGILVDTNVFETSLIDQVIRRLKASPKSLVPLIRQTEKA
jgi:hypothetical protein